MSVYFVAQIKIHDEAEYSKYLQNVDEVFSRYRGKYLAVDTNPIVLEGEWNHDRMVLIEFPDKDAFEEWYTSPEYQRILQHRLNGATCDTVLVRGL